MKQEFVMNNKKHPVWLNQKGYACVTINEDGKDRAFLLHRLVWETENGPVPESLCEKWVKCLKLQGFRHFSHRL